MMGIQYITICMILFAACMVATAQTTYGITDCLGITDPVDGLDEWQGVQGVDIWYGYDEEPAWGLPDDAVIYEWVRFDTSEGKRWLIILASDSTPETLYALSFRSLRPHTDASGKHYGPHPCGVYAFDTEVIE